MKIDVKHLKFENLDLDLKHLKFENLDLILLVYDNE
jgi:hypothetical protein